CGKARGPEVVLARLGKRRCSSPAAAGLTPKLFARPVPAYVTVPVFSAANKPVLSPACLHTNAVFTATQINPQKSVFSGVPATADGVSCVVRMPTAQCPSLHTSTACHTGLAHIKPTQIGCALKHVPTNATLCMSHGFCKNETSVHSLHSSEQCFRCDKCARCPAPTSTHRHDSSYGNRPALPLAVDRRRGVERGQSARCYQRAPCLK
ncbi:hypothetical protein PO909_013269, partial [Leuciscus waleckii]